MSVVVAISVLTSLSGAPKASADFSKELTEIADAQRGVTAAKDDAARAQAWLEVQARLDALAKALDQRGPRRGAADALEVKLRKALEPQGVTVSYCEVGDSWISGVEPYRRYLELLPQGPSADVAYWYTVTEERRCGDFEPSVEAYGKAIRSYRDFVARFPKSPRREAAEASIKFHESELAAWMEQEKARAKTPGR